MKNLEFFQKYRAEQLAVARSIIESAEFNKHVLIHAPVKSGKREIVQATALVDPGYIHIFTTALSRVDIYPQLKEFADYRVVVCAKNKWDKLLEVIEDKKDDRFIIHFDESDYGTGIDSLSKDLIPKIIDNPRITIVLYSATNYEAWILSKQHEKKFDDVYFIPHHNYRGAKWFLDNNLVEDGWRFLNQEQNGLSTEAIDLLSEWCNQTNRFCSVLRIASRDQYRSLKNDEDLITKIRRIGISEVVFIDYANAFNWQFLNNGQGSFDRYYNAYKKNNNYKVLFVICQTCTRSTEVQFHKYIYFWHDHRESDTGYDSYAQALLRVCHYDQYGHPIKVFGKKEIFKLAANVITLATFCNNGNKLSDRIKTEKMNVKRVKYIPIPVEHFGSEYLKTQIWGSANVTAIIVSVKKFRTMDLADAILNGIRPTLQANEKFLIKIDGMSELYPDRYKDLINLPSVQSILKQNMQVVFLPIDEENAKIVDRLYLRNSIYNICERIL